MFERNSSLRRRASITAMYCCSSCAFDSSSAPFARRRSSIIDAFSAVAAIWSATICSSPRSSTVEQPGLREVERHGAQHARRRLQRQRHERAEAELRRDLLPIGERRIREEIGHVDRAPLSCRLPARTESDAHAHVAEEGAEARGPVVRCREPHHIVIVRDRVDRRERGADQRAHTIERELEDILRPVGREEGMHDLADGNQLPNRGIRWNAGRVRS